MLSIACPFCGPRDETEFRCGGQAHLLRPDSPAKATDKAWGAYLFTRANPKGPGLERWVHWAGCRQWFNVARDTRTHEILAVYRMGKAAPDMESPA